MLPPHEFNILYHKKIVLENLFSLNLIICQEFTKRLEIERQDDKQYSARLE